MRDDGVPLFCVAAIALLSGCTTRTVEIRPVAPVVESRSVPLTTRAAAPQSSQQVNSDSGAARQPASGSADETGNSSSVRVEAAIPGVYSGRSLSFERSDYPVRVGPAEP